MSLLLTIAKQPLSKICIPNSLADSFLPCKNSTLHNNSLLDESGTCGNEGKVPLVPAEDIQRLQMLIPDYLEGCRFLPKLNNELPNERNSTYKERFSRLQNLVLIMAENDKVLVPPETSWFGYYPDGGFDLVLPPQQATLYKEDWIGLRALDEAGRVKFISVPGGHLRISRSCMKKYIVPYLKDGPLKEPVPKSSGSRWILSA